MKYLTSLTHVSGDVYRVGLCHNRPFDAVHGLGKTEAELLSTGVLVETVPEPQVSEGMQTTGIFVNRATKKVWWEYEQAPVTQEERLRADLAYLAVMTGVEL